MDRQFNSDKPPDKLTERLQAGLQLRVFRRRVVLTKSSDNWALVCCTVEAMSLGEGTSQPPLSRRYPQAALYEDFLTGEECLAFALALQRGDARFSDFDLPRVENPQWTTEFVPLVNDYMTRAGYVISLRFATLVGRGSVGPLLSPDQPYYPDIADAARDWLPFPVYHGERDGRNDQIVFLLPETRAYFSDAAFSKTGTLEITVAGTDLNALSLIVKGAYWEGNSIRHLDKAVTGAKAELAVPDDAERLEYVLMDLKGTVYDLQREDRFGHTGLGRRKLSGVNRGLVEQVRSACQAGEGLHVEFKPFIEPEQKLSFNGQKTKLGEVIATVVAFSNTEGGHIYLGVEDDCSVRGIDQDIRAWAKGALDESAIDRYLGALKSKIKEVVHGEVTLHLSHTEFDGVLVVVIDVAQAMSRPIAIWQDRHLYVRTGASNQKAPPEQWKSILYPHMRGPLSWDPAT